MDGYEATRRIREWEVENCDLCQATQETEPKMECETVRACPHCHLPVVAVTADVMKGTHELCFSAGMDDYIPKPLNQNQLYKLLERFLKNKLGNPPSSPK
jgi:histidine kinase 2/3/4 (cytokinin receptor)